MLPFSSHFRCLHVYVQTERKEDIGYHICPFDVMVELPSLDSVFHKESMYFFKEEDYDWYLSLQMEKTCIPGAHDLPIVDFIFSFSCLCGSTTHANQQRPVYQPH